MTWYEILWVIALIVTHATAYYWGKSDAKETFKPSNDAWVAVQCYALDKQYEFARWAKEHAADETDKAAERSD